MVQSYPFFSPQPTKELSAEGHKELSLQHWFPAHVELSRHFTRSPRLQEGPALVLVIFVAVASTTPTAKRDSQGEAAKYGLVVIERQDVVEVIVMVGS